MLTARICDRKILAMIIAIRLLSSNEIIEVDVAFAVLLPVTRPRLPISSIAPSLIITTPV